MTVPLWRWLEDQGAQRDIVEWARPYEADWARAYSECPRGDWLLGLAARRGVERRSLVRAACACAEIAIDYLPDPETRVRAALDAAHRWLDDRDDAADRARKKDALEAAIDEAPDPAVSAAAMAAFAAISSIDAPDEAPVAAAAVAQAAVMDVGECAVMSALGYAQRTCADRVREHVPFSAIAIE